MPTLLGISGSLRRQSFNTALLRAAAGLLPDGSTLTIQTLHGVPLYDGDDEAANGIPPAVAAIKDAMAAADGIIIATPEYNGSMPGVLKNAIDWCSRPPADIARVFGGKPTALIGASAGGFGTVLAQAAWLPVLRKLGVDIWGGAQLALTHSSKLFDEHGTLIDDSSRQRLQTLVTGFVAYVDSRRR